MQAPAWPGCCTSAASSPVFAATTGPLVPYYTERGILVAVDADQPPDSVTADIQTRLSGLPLTP